MGQLTKVANLSEISPGHAKLVEVGDKKIALFNVENSFYAIGDSCTHRGESLSKGTLEGTTVTCPWHSAKFDLKTGEAVGPPATQAVPTYTVKVEGSEIKIELP